MGRPFLRTFSQRFRSRLKAALLVSALLLASTSRLHPQGGITSRAPNMEAINSLPIEHRRYLLYLYARLAKPAVAEMLAENILRDLPDDRQTYLVLASMYLELRLTEKALNNGKTLAELFPGDDQAIYFLAAAHYQAGQFEESNAILRKIKERTFKGQLYPYETDLASAAMGAGDWYKAMLSYQELLRNHSLSDELRLQTRAVLEEIYREHLPQAAVQHEVIWLDEGMIHRTTADYRQHFKDSYRLFARMGREHTKIERAFGIRGQDTDNWDATVGLEIQWSGKWSSRVWMGGWERGLMYGASATRNLGTGRQVTWEFRADERVQEGLFIQALNGRQYRLGVQGSYLINQKWLALAEVYGREIHVDDHMLGYGVGGTVNLEHIFLHEKPNFRAGYRGQVSYFKIDSDVPSSYAEQFLRAADPGETAPDAAPPRGRQRILPSDPREALIATLVTDYYHRHGLYLRFEDVWSGFIYPFGTVGTDYALELDSIEYYAQGGFRVYPRKSIELRLEGGYSSSSTTSGQGSEQWNMIAGLKLWF